MKYSAENLRILERCHYEAFGLSYVFNPNWLTGSNHLEAFHSLRKEIKEFVANGGVFTHNLVKLDRSKVPFIYNSINL